MKLIYKNAICHILGVLPDYHSTKANNTTSKRDTLYLMSRKPIESILINVAMKMKIKMQL